MKDHDVLLPERTSPTSDRFRPSGPPVDDQNVGRWVYTDRGKALWPPHASDHDPTEVSSVVAAMVSLFPAFDPQSRERNHAELWKGNERWLAVRSGSLVFVGRVAAEESLDQFLSRLMQLSEREGWGELFEEAP